MINLSALAASTGLNVAQLESYLARCDDVIQIAGGVLVRLGNEVHIHAPQKGLSGRRLLAETKAGVARFFERCDVLLCPVEKGNARAERFVERLGFRCYEEVGVDKWYWLRGDL